MEFAGLHHAVQLAFQAHDLIVDGAAAAIDQPWIDLAALGWSDGSLATALAKLRFQQAGTLPQQPEFHIRPNRLVAYKYVAGVMATAQKLGITNIGLVGTT